MRVPNVFSSANQWLIETPERALDQAYRSALKIKEIEDKYFQGRGVSPDNAEYSSRVVGYFQTEVKNYLQNIKVRVIEFNFSRNIVNLAAPSRRRYRRARQPQQWEIQFCRRPRLSSRGIPRRRPRLGQTRRVDG